MVEINVLRKTGFSISMLVSKLLSYTVTYLYYILTFLNGERVKILDSDQLVTH